MPSKADELFVVTDEQDNPIEPLPRRLVHGHGVWHRVSHIWLVNDQKQVLCQQRALDKEVNPGYWEAFFGGHHAPGETYESAAVRELREELGIAVKASDLNLWKVFKFHHSTGYNNEFQGIFVLKWNGAISDAAFHDGEVAQIAWRSISEVKAAIQTQSEPWTNCGYELDLLTDVDLFVASNR